MVPLFLAFRRAMTEVKILKVKIERKKVFIEVLPPHLLNRQSGEEPEYPFYMFQNRLYVFQAHPLHHTEA